LKTEERGKNPVPVIPVLRRALEEHKKHSSRTGFVFAGEKKGFALNLDNLSRRVIHPMLKDGWHGWHGFRRGLSTNLHSLGVADKVIQEILRHATVATTQAHYIVIDQSKRREAMKRLEQAWNKQRRNRRTHKKNREKGQK